LRKKILKADMWVYYTAGRCCVRWLLLAECLTATNKNWSSPRFKINAQVFNILSSSLR